MEEVLVRGGFKAETIEGWEVSEDQKRIWNIEMIIAKELFRVCKKHNLFVVAGFGTLLGAVRHDGFIPWDDDIDFMMPRHDYEKLCSLADEFEEPFFLQNTKTEHGNWFRGIARLRYSPTTCINPLDTENEACNNGIFVDIMPLDSRPKDGKPLAQYIHRKRTSHLKTTTLRRLYADYYKKYRPGLKTTALNLICAVLAHGRSVEKLSDDYDRLCSKYNRPGAEGYRVISFNYIKGSRFDFDMDIDDLKPRIWHKFENMEIPIPANYDSCLRKTYGDSYMEFPPLEKRVAQDKNVVDPYTPYKEYMKNHKQELTEGRD